MHAAPSMPRSVARSVASTRRRLAGWLIAVLFLLPAAARAYADDGGRSVPFSGRLVDEHGAPISGSVDLQLNFFAQPADGQPLLAEPLAYAKTPLAEGVFTIDVHLGPAELSRLFPDPERVIFLQVKDVSHHRVYQRQRFSLPSPPPGPSPTVAAVAGSSTASSAADAAPAVAAAATLVGPPASAATVPAVAAATTATIAAVAAATTATVPAAATRAIPASPALVAAAAAACMGSQGSGGKFLLQPVERQQTCAAACGAVQAGITCVRGWTLYPNGQYFDFGNECTLVQSAANLLPDGHLCCCLSAATPAPLVLGAP